MYLRLLSTRSFAIILMNGLETLVNRCTWPLLPAE
jgi:hypothetical protein